MQTHFYTQKTSPVYYYNLYYSLLLSGKVPVKDIKVMECTKKSHFVMSIPTNFQWGQLSSPTAGIFPGQALTHRCVH